MAEHETVAVSVSGGLDSLAVLLAVACIADLDGRKVIATMAEMTDDAGASNVPVVQRLMAAAGLHHITLLVTSLDDLPANPPDWRLSGPDLDALPLANRRLAEVAADHGATVMLGGNGADEVLGAVRYLFGSYIASGDWRALRSYWRDSIGVDRQAVRLESLGLAARLLPGAWRASMYFAFEWPELCRAPVPDIIGSDYRKHVADWSAQWVAETIGYHATYHRLWASMAAWDAVFPLHILTGPGPIPLRHPFLTPDFIAAVWQLPLSQRYDPQLPLPYWRQKAQVISLLPEFLRSVLPTAKQTFRSELSSRFLAAKRDPSCLIAHHVVEKQAWEATTDPLLVNQVNRLEAWLCEAIQRGHTVTRD
jgi:asparagine synthase (glutamine-hydrolysing)